MLCEVMKLKKYRATIAVIVTICLQVLIAFFIVTNVTRPLPAVVVQEEPLILQVDDGRQFQLLGTSGSTDESYIVYIDIKTGRVKFIVQARRVIFEE